MKPITPELIVDYLLDKSIPIPFKYKCEILKDEGLLADEFKELLDGPVPDKYATTKEGFLVADKDLKQYMVDLMNQTINLDGLEYYADIPFANWVAHVYNTGNLVYDYALTLRDNFSGR